MSSSTQNAGDKGAKAPPMGFFGQQARRNPATVAREANARRIEEEQNQQQQEKNEAKHIVDKRRRRSRQEANDTPETSDPIAKQYQHNLPPTKKRGFFWGLTDEELNQFLEEGYDEIAIEVQQSRARNKKRAFYWELTDEDLNEFVDKGDDKIAIDVHADRTGKEKRSYWSMTRGELKIAADGDDELARRTLEAKRLACRLSRKKKSAKLKDLEEGARNGDQDAIAEIEYHQRQMRDKIQRQSQRESETREAEKQRAAAGEVEALKALELRREKDRKKQRASQARKRATTKSHSTAVDTLCTSQSEVDEEAEMRRASMIEVDDGTGDDIDEDDDSEDDPNEDLDILPGMILEEERQKKEQKGHDREEERAGEVDDDHSDELRKGSPSGNARLGSSKPSAATTVVNKEELGQQGEDHGYKPRHNHGKGKEKE